MLQINGLEQGLDVFRALGSEARMKIVHLLAQNRSMNLNELATSLGLTNGALTAHIRKLEECGLIRVEVQHSGRGLQKVCSLVEDQILLKADGYPTYNFANIIDDHLMKISHVVRGSEYLSSTPKYNLCYEAFGWDIPTYVHLPLIQGKNDDGTVSKLSKRHGSTGFEDLVAQGFLPEAIINYIALLGWCPKDNQEVFSLPELCEAFDISGISKSPSVFDYDKLEWFNGEYIRKMSQEEFIEFAKPELEKFPMITPDLYPLFTEIMQPRITRLPQISEKLGFLLELADYDLELYVHKKSKTTKEGSLEMLNAVLPILETIEWTKDSISECLTGFAEGLGVKNALVMWPVRIAASGTAVTPGGAVEVLLLLGKEEALKRIESGRQRLSAALSQ